MKHSYLETLSIDKGNLTDTRTIIRSTYQLPYICCSWVFLSFLMFGLGYLTKDHFFTNCEPDGSL